MNSLITWPTKSGAGLRRKETHDTVARDTIAMTTVLSKFGGTFNWAMQDKQKNR